MKTDIKIHFTLIHRILHWIMAFAMPVLFLTGFLRMNWMNKKHIIGIIESKTDLLAKEQSMEIAKSILEPICFSVEISKFASFSRFRPEILRELLAIEDVAKRFELLFLSKAFPDATMHTLERLYYQHFARPLAGILKYLAYYLQVVLP